MVKDIGKIVHSVGLAEKAKAAKRTQFLALLTDPDISDLVKELLNAAVVEEPPNLGDEPKQVPSTGLRAAIIGLIPELQKVFNLNHVLALLEKQNFPFIGSNHKNSVRDALYSLANGKNPMLRVAKPGDPGRGEPNLYEFIGGKP
jgi:hypothetical protein